MSRRPITLVARRSIRAHLGRTIVIALAMILSVSAVVGSFVLADSLRSTFDNLFSELSEDVDLVVRASIAFGDDAAADRDPIPAELVDQIAAVDGVASVEPGLQRYAQLVDQDGDPIQTAGAPTLGVAWTGDEDLGGLTIKGEGVPPSGADQVAIDKATADRENYDVGDQIDVITDTGTRTFTIAALVGLGNTDGFAGATLAAFDYETALDVLGAEGMIDSVAVAVADGVPVDTVRQQISEILSERTEIVTGEEVAEENSSAVGDAIGFFSTFLLVFAFITAFVSAFIIFNVFQITIGQRLRELALMRAVGASGRQVRRMITIEALVMGVTATLLGIAGGIGVAKLIVALFNAAGAGFPDTGTVLTLRTYIAASIVGIGVTLASVAIPARRAARIPPVAAMRPELGFAALSPRRLVAGVLTTVAGAVLFLVGLFVGPGGTIGLAAFAGIGALTLFLGVASVSSTVARPVTHFLGWPIAKLFGTPGILARDNAARSPRRTSSTAAALMIGVALVSAAAVFAASLRDTFTRTLDRAVTADYIITDESFQGLPPTVADKLATLPELSAVSPIRGISAQIDGDQKALGAADPSALGDLVDIDLKEGSYADLGDGGVLVHKDPADDLDLQVGDTLDVTYQNGVEGTLRVAGIYDDASVVGNWLISIQTLESVTDIPPRDFFVVARLTEGVDPTVADEAVRSAMEEFPQVKVQTNAEFRKEQEDQINQLLLVITILLVFSIVIAIIGIAITLALGVFERTREIGLLRAVGMTKRQTRRSVRWEAVIVSVFGAVVGVVLGSLIGAALAMAVPATVIDGITFPVGRIIIVLVFAVLAGLLAAVYPAYKASRMDILKAIVTE